MACVALVPTPSWLYRWLSVQYFPTCSNVFSIVTLIAYSSLDFFFPTLVSCSSVHFSKPFPGIPRQLAIRGQFMSCLYNLLTFSVVVPSRAAPVTGISTQHLGLSYSTGFPEGGLLGWVLGRFGPILIFKESEEGL